MQGLPILQWQIPLVDVAAQRLPAPDHHCVGRAVEEFFGAELEQNGAPSRSGVRLALRAAK